MTHPEHQEDPDRTDDPERDELPPDAPEGLAARYGPMFTRSGGRLTLEQINAASRNRPQSAPAAVPDIPADRYDVCTCGAARFLHDGRPFTWLTFTCAGPFVLAEPFRP